MIFTNTTPSIEPRLSADKGGDFGAFSLPGKAKELQVSSSVDSPMTNASSLANPPGSVPFMRLSEDNRQFSASQYERLLVVNRENIKRWDTSLSSGNPLERQPGHGDGIGNNQYVYAGDVRGLDRFAPEAALDLWYICAAQNVRALFRDMTPILEQPLETSGLLRTWSKIYDGYRDVGYGACCSRDFYRLPSEGRDALLELEAFEKLHYDRSCPVREGLFFYSITENRHEYDKVCGALDFKVEVDDNGCLSEDFGEKSEKYKSSFILPQEEFLAGFKVRLDRAVASLTTCPMMRRGDSKKALPEIIECVRELYRRASSND